MEQELHSVFLQFFEELPLSYEIINTGHGEKIFVKPLCYIEGNEAAKKLYESFGFSETDRDDDEVIMELALR